MQAASQGNSLGGGKKISTVMSESIHKNLDSTKDRELILPKLQKVKEPIIKA